MNHSERVFELKDETTELINLGSEKEKLVDNPERVEMIALFKEYLDVFVWSYRDMSGLDS